MMLHFRIMMYSMNFFSNLKPVNPCFERGPKSNVVDPRRWQPNMVNRAGIRTCQKFVTPQHSRTKGIVQNPMFKLLIVHSNLEINESKEQNDNK